MGAGNDYVIQVKGNQGRLLKRIQEICKHDTPVDISESTERSRGRTVTREIEVYLNSGGIDEDWIELNRIIKVTREGKRKKKYFKEEHYYIASLKRNSASYFGSGIRSHWGIENKVHWVKDVVMNEDNCRIKSSQLVSNLSLIRSWVISLYRLNNLPSITKATEKYNNKLDLCMELMEITHISEN